MQLSYTAIAMYHILKDAEWQHSARSNTGSVGGDVKLIIISL